jgi:hypothetical protein
MKGIYFFTIGIMLFLAGGFFFSKIRNREAAASLESTQKAAADSIKQLYCDSLKNELFIQETNVHRYELSLEHLREEDPKAAKIFEDFLSHRTE